MQVKTEDRALHSEEHYTCLHNQLFTPLLCTDQAGFGCVLPCVFLKKEGSVARTPTGIVMEADKGPSAEGGCIRLNIAKAFSVALSVGNPGVFVRNALRLKKVLLCM